MGIFFFCYLSSNLIFCFVCSLLLKSEVNIRYYTFRTLVYARCRFSRRKYYCLLPRERNWKIRPYWYFEINSDKTKWNRLFWTKVRNVEIWNLFFAFNGRQVGQWDVNMRPAYFSPPVSAFLRELPHLP